jgi:hypothetical protein
MNYQRFFDPIQKEKLGKYIYALRDPRDRKIFYVGQGQNDRVFDHFIESERCLKTSMPFKEMSSKVIRILDIWNNNEDVEWIILAHNLGTDSNIADLIESGIFDVLSESQNGETLNEFSPPNSSRLLPEDLDAMASEPVNPNLAYENVFIFPIQNALIQGRSPYDATRSVWFVSSNNQALTPAYAVGLKHSISRGSYEISSWRSVEGTGKHEFQSKGHPKPEDYLPLLNKNWNNIIAVAKGFWQRGNYLIVSFNGKGQFKMIRGSKDTETWHNCIQ